MLCCPLRSPPPPAAAPLAPCRTFLAMPPAARRPESRKLMLGGTPALTGVASAFQGPASVPVRFSQSNVVPSALYRPLAGPRLPVVLVWQAAGRGWRGERRGAAAVLVGSTRRPAHGGGGVLGQRRRAELSAGRRVQRLQGPAVHGTTRRRSTKPVLCWFDQASPICTRRSSLRAPCSWPSRACYGGGCTARSSWTASPSSSCPLPRRGSGWPCASAPRRLTRPPRARSPPPAWWRPTTRARTARGRCTSGTSPTPTRCTEIGGPSSLRRVSA